MSWSKAVQAIAESVSATANAIAAYGPNDEGKATRAAKSAGTKAKNSFKKAYPKCETNKEFEKKIVPLIEQGLMDERVTDRPSYNFVRAQLIDEVYNDTYKQVMELYHQRIVKESGGLVPYDTQQDFDNAVDEALQKEKDLQLNFSAGENSGCMGFALVLVASGSFLVSLLFNLI